MTAVLIVLIICVTAAFVTTRRNPGRRTSLEVAGMKLAMDETLQHVQEINAAVNHKPEGEPTLYEHAAAANRGVEELGARVTAVEDTQHVFGQVFDKAHERLDSRLDVIEQKLEPAAGPGPGPDAPA